MKGIAALGIAVPFTVNAVAQPGTMNDPPTNSFSSGCCKIVSHFPVHMSGPNYKPIKTPLMHE